VGAKGMEVYLAINHHPGTNPTSSQIVFSFIFVALSCSLGHFGVRCWGLVESWTHKEDVLIGKQRVWKGGFLNLETKAEIMGGVGYRDWDRLLGEPCTKKIEGPSGEKNFSKIEK